MAPSWWIKPLRKTRLRSASGHRADHLGDVTPLRSHAEMFHCEDQARVAVVAPPAKRQSPARHQAARYEAPMECRVGRASQSSEELNPSSAKGQLCFPRTALRAHAMPWILPSAHRLSAAWVRIFRRFGAP